MFLFGDMIFFLLIPVLIMAFWAQNKVKSNYKKFDKQQNSAGLSGRDVARRMLDNNNLTDVKINAIEGELTDHFDPRKRVVNLSENVYYNTSVSAISIAAHECGHAVQHTKEYLPVKIRSAIVPVASFGSQAAFPLFIIGLFANIGLLMDLGIIFFSGALLFHLVTLPYEGHSYKARESIFHVIWEIENWLKQHVKQVE